MEGAKRKREAQGAGREARALSAYRLPLTAYGTEGAKRKAEAQGAGRLPLSAYRLPPGAYRPRRHPSHFRIRRHVFGHHGAGTDDGSIANRHAFQHNHPAPSQTSFPIATRFDTSCCWLTNLPGACAWSWSVR